MMTFFSFITWSIVTFCCFGAICAEGSLMQLKSVRKLAHVCEYVCMYIYAYSGVRWQRRIHVDRMYL